MIIRPIKTRVFQEGDDLLKFIAKYVPRLRAKSILVVTSKIVALSQRRINNLISDKNFTRLVKAESSWALKTRHTWLTIKDGSLMANAGIDKSNGNGKLILLPRNSYKIADKLHRQLCRYYKIKQLGVVITDSRIAPLRAGVMGVAVGYAGFQGVKDYRGQPDLFGRKFKISRVDVADSLATAAVLVMGEGAECCPLAVIINAPVRFVNKINRRELKISLADDMYGPLFRPLKLSR